MLLTENTLFDKRYQLERLLGRGGFSEVWLAKDSYTKLEIAIKVYAPGQGMDSNDLADFSAELAGVFNLNHTNLLKPTHVDDWEGMPYLIMPFCSHGSISKQIGKLSEQELWHVLHDVAAGLAYLHKNDIVHQDIKPDNILLDDSGNYVITDFGISTKARSTLRKSVIGGTVSGGTMAYMGPERFSKQPAPTKASDIWSLGAMMFELITGNVPFGEMGGGMQKSGAEIPEITEPISDQLQQTVESMLAPNTWDRPTAEQLLTGIVPKISRETVTEAKKEMSTRPTQRFAQTPSVETIPVSSSAVREDESVKTIPVQKRQAPSKKSINKKTWLGILIGLGVFIFAIFVIYGVRSLQKGTDPSELAEQPLPQEEVVKERIPDNFVLIAGGTLYHYCYDHTKDRWDPIYGDFPIDSFYICKYEVMQKDYAALMPDNPSPIVGDSLPVSNITFAEAAIYCNRLSQKEGYEGFYIIHNDTITFNPNGRGYRLPTNYEWAYAARDRHDRAYKYAAGDNLKDIAWYAMNSNMKAHIVGTKTPNELGLYDMSGNVFEMIWSDDEKVIKGWTLGGGFDMYNFSSETYREYNRIGGGWGLNTSVGFRLAFVPHSIQTNNNITNLKKRRLFHQYKYTWDYGNGKYEAELPYQEGRLYEYGYGCKQDINEAKRWYRIAADHGDAKAKNRLNQLNQ